jgi:hypothetical protein
MARRIVVIVNSADEYEPIEVRVEVHNDGAPATEPVGGKSPKQVASEKVGANATRPKRSNSRKKGGKPERKVAKVGAQEAIAVVVKDEQVNFEPKRVFVENNDETIQPEVCRKKLPLALYERVKRYFTDPDPCAIEPSNKTRLGRLTDLFNDEVVKEAAKHLVALAFQVFSLIVKVILILLLLSYLSCSRAHCAPRGNEQARATNREWKQRNTTDSPALLRGAAFFLWRYFNTLLSSLLKQVSFLRGFSVCMA